MVDETGEAASPLSIDEGWTQYLTYCGRSPVLGGVTTNTLKRYRLIRDRHTEYCRQHGVQRWSEFDKSHFEKYGNWMFAKFAYRTSYVDLTQVKAVVKWLVGEGLLPAECRISYALRKPTGSDTYCYTQVEVAAIVDYCETKPTLLWLARVIVALAHLGLRFGELASLRWVDVDLRAGLIRVADERSSPKKLSMGTARTTKGRRARTIPLHPEMKKLLLALPRQQRRSSFSFGLRPATSRE